MHVIEACRKNERVIINPLNAEQQNTGNKYINS